MINTEKTLTGNDGFVQTENIVYRLYTLLDGFTVETAGVYSYLKSWKNNAPTKEYFGCVWLSREEIYAQTGIGRRAFTRHLDALVACGLVVIRKSRKVVNKQIFEIRDPLTEAEFRVTYPEAVVEFERKITMIYATAAADTEAFEVKKAEWKAAGVTEERGEQPDTPPVEPIGYAATGEPVYF